MSLVDDLEIICGLMPKTELLAQLAEEATELAHAALKLRRVCDGTNPTPVTEKQAVENLLEEIADVELCLIVLEYSDIIPTDDIEQIVEAKRKRWARRLDENR